MADKKNKTDLLDTLLESISSDAVITESAEDDDVDVDDVVDDMEIEESEDPELQPYYDQLSNVYESVIKDVLKAFIYESDMSSDAKIAKLEQLETLEITESHVEKFIEKYISPITEMSRITKVEDITESVVVPLGAYQIATRLNEAFGADEEGETLFESIFGKELQEDVKEQLNADIKELIESSGLEFETEADLREFIEAADEIRELVDTDVVIPDIFDVAENVLVMEARDEAYWERMPPGWKVDPKDVKDPRSVGTKIKHNVQITASNAKYRTIQAANAAKAKLGAGYRVVADKSGKGFAVVKTKSGAMVAAGRRAMATKKGKAAAAGLATTAAVTGAAVAYKKLKARKAAAATNESVVDPIEGTVAFLEAFIVEGEHSSNAVIEYFIEVIKSIE